MSNVNTYDFTTLTENKYFIINNGCLIVIKEYDDYYMIYFMVTYGTSKQIYFSFDSYHTIRYHEFNSSSSDSRIRLLSGADEVFEVYDNKNSDELASNFSVTRRFIEFNWLTN